MRRDVAVEQRPAEGGRVDERVHGEPDPGLPRVAGRGRGGHAISDPEAQGLAMGACAHAIGTATSAEQGITQGAFASLAMVVCGILTAAVAPLLFAIYHWLS